MRIRVYVYTQMHTYLSKRKLTYAEYMSCAAYMPQTDEPTWMFALSLAVVVCLFVELTLRQIGQVYIYTEYVHTCLCVSGEVCVCVRERVFVIVCVFLLLNVVMCL